MSLANNRFVIHINNKDKLTIEELAFVLFFAGSAIRFIVVNGFGFIGLSDSADFLTSGLLVFTGTCILLGIIKKGVLYFGKCLIFLGFICLILIASYLLNPEIGIWLSPDHDYGIAAIFGLDGGIFSAGVIAFIVVIIQKDSKSIFRSLKICNVLMSIYLMLMLYTRISRGYFSIDNVNGVMVKSLYNMSFGYFSAFIGTLNFILWKREKKIFNLILGFFLAISSILYGSRGIIVIFALFAATMLWISLRNVKLSRRLLMIAVILVMTFVIVCFYTEILLGIQLILSLLGISDSRTMSKLLSGELSDANGRDRIWSMAWEMIKERFPLGYGAYGERAIIGQSFRWGYCHNLFLEIIIAFGLIGVIVLIFMIIKSALLINNESDKDWNLLFILFFSNCGMLFVSNTFWTHPYFWATIAVGVIYSKYIKMKQRSNTKLSKQVHEL